MKKVIYIANFIKRTNAYFIDFAMVMFLILMCVFSLMGWIQIVILLGGLYLLICLIPTLTHGQTIGKKIMKLQSTHVKNNQPLAWWEIHLREITKYALCICTFGLSHIISYFMCSERSDHRTIHDLIFRTQVIDINPTLTSHEQDRFAEDDYYKNYQTQRTIR